MRVYLDFQALVEDSGAQSNPTSVLRLRKFLGGFSQVEPLYDIVDTGPGEKEALIKIKGKSQLFAKLSQTWQPNPDSVWQNCLMFSSPTCNASTSTMAALWMRLLLPP